MVETSSLQLRGYSLIYQSLMFCTCVEASILFSCRRQPVELKYFATPDSDAFSSCCCSTATLNYEPNQYLMLLFLTLRSLAQVLSLTGLNSSELCYVFCFLSPRWDNCQKGVHCYASLSRSKTPFLFPGWGSILEPAYTTTESCLSCLQSSALLCFCIIKRAMFITKPYRRLILFATVSLATI